MRRLDPITLAAIGIALIAIGSSAPLIAYAAAPALAIAFWRNALAVGVIAPVALLRRRDELVGLRRDRTWLWSVLAGLALSVHFATWVPSVKLTSVATATALVATQPIWAGVIAVVTGRRLGKLTWTGILLAVAGAAVATGADFQLGGSAVLGDVLAVVGGMAAAVYTTLGERARRNTSTTSYTTICYGVSALILLALCLLTGVRLTGFAPTAWAAIIGLTVGAQLLGHSMLNYALHKVSATAVSVLILLEVPTAALLGWAWLGQTPPSAAWPGLLLLIVGLAFVILGSNRAPVTQTVQA